MKSSRWLLAIVAACALVSAAKADVVQDSVNLNANADPNFFWGSTDVGWQYTPSTSYDLSGVETKFSVPNNRTTQSRSVTVVLFQGSPSGSLLGSFGFLGTSTNTLEGGSFSSPISLTAGTQYFIGFENVGPISPPNDNVLGVNFTEDAGATFLSDVFFDGDNSHSFSGETGGILGQPILAFLAPEPNGNGGGGDGGGGTAVPEPGSLAIFGSALLGLGAVGWYRRRKNDGVDGAAA